MIRVLMLTKENNLVTIEYPILFSYFVSAKIGAVVESTVHIRPLTTPETIELWVDQPNSLKNEATSIK